MEKRENIRKEFLRQYGAGIVRPSNPRPYIEWLENELEKARTANKITKEGMNHAN